MARRRTKRTKRAKPRPGLIPMIATVAPPAASAYTSWKSGQGADGVAVNLVYGYTGYDMTNQKWDMAGMKNILAPTVVGLGVSMVGKKLKLNRYVPKWLPFNIF